jgi:hypothetical protein
MGRRPPERAGALPPPLLPVRLLVPIACLLGALPVACAADRAAPAAPAVAPWVAPGTAPPGPGTPNPPAVPVGTDAGLDRLSAAIAATVASDSGAARATLTATGRGTTVVATSSSTWHGSDWARRVVVDDGAAPPVTLDLVRVGGIVYVATDGGPWASGAAPDAGLSPVAVRDPAQVLAVLQGATAVGTSDAPGRLQVHVAADVLFGPDAGDADVVLDVGLAAGPGGVETVAAVEGIVPGVPALVVTARWELTEPVVVHAPVGRAPAVAGRRGG